VGEALTVDLDFAERNDLGVHGTLGSRLQRRNRRDGPQEAMAVSRPSVDLVSAASACMALAAVSGPDVAAQR
jgi:dTDP-4-dehydrorhamnose reductase